MKFKKLSDNKIKCIISHEEMQENGIDVGDFLTNQEKTHEFIRNIMKEACEVLDIKPTSAAYSVQMTVGPEGDLSLVISPDFGETIKQALSDIKDQLVNAKQNLESGDVQKALQSLLPGSLVRENAKALEKKEQEKQQAAGGIDNLKNLDHIANTPFWCAYHTLDDCISVAKSVQGYDIMESQLYKYDSKYYLRLRSSEDAKNLSSIVLAVSEFGAGIFTEPTDGAYIREHGKLISKNAIAELGCL